MDNLEFARKLEARTKALAIEIIKLSASLPDKLENRVVKHQLTKSGTSIGANYREANRSRSKPDFKNKLKICESEASETVYWLGIIDDMKWCNDQVVESVLKEANEILAIFISVGKKL